MFEVDPGGGPRDGMEAGYRGFGSTASPGFFQSPGNRVSPGGLGTANQTVPTYRPSPVVRRPLFLVVQHPHPCLYSTHLVVCTAANPLSVR